MSATTMSAFARPMTTRAFSISKMRPESGPEIHARESRWSAGRRRRARRLPVRARHREAVRRGGRLRPTDRTRAFGRGGHDAVRSRRAGGQDARRCPRDSGGRLALLRLGERGLVESEFVTGRAGRGTSRGGGGGGGGGDGGGTGDGNRERRVPDLEHGRALRALDFLHSRAAEARFVVMVTSLARRALDDHVTRLPPDRTFRGIRACPASSIKPVRPPGRAPPRAGPPREAGPRPLRRRSFRRRSEPSRALRQAKVRGRGGRRSATSCPRGRRSPPRPRSRRDPVPRRASPPPRRERAPTWRWRGGAPRRR